MKPFIFLILFFSNLSYSQIDTAKIFTEIRHLSTDLLIEKYWIKLDSCDQDFGTFSNPIKQIENLLKCCYFFKIHGFSKASQFENDSLTYSSNTSPARQSLIVWMHSSFSDLNYYTFPLIYECKKIYIHFDYLNYFLQNLLIARHGDFPELYNKVTKKVENNSFNQLEIKKIVELANEFISLKIADSIKVVGNWKCVSFDKQTNDSSEYKIQIFKSLDDSYYLESFNIFKLTKNNSKKSNIFQFTNNLDGTFLEIIENGNLVNKDENGEILVIYTKEL